MRRLQADPSFLDSHSTLEIILILGTVAVAALAVAALAFRIRSRWLLAAVLALGVAQLFGPFGFTSVALLATCTLLPAAFWRARESLRDLRSPATIWTILLAALACWQAVSVLWSAKLGSAGYGVVFSVALLTAFLLARDVVRRDPHGVSAAIAVASPLVIISALAVVAFRLWPGLEGAYLLSPIARLLSEPDVILVTSSEIAIALDPISTLGVFAGVAGPPGAAGGMFEGMFDSNIPTGFQNVLDPEKAGGFFLNGNTASLFFAITACAAAWAFVGRRHRGAHAAAVIASLAAIVATGSKTAVLLLIALPVLALFIAFAVRRPRLGAVVGSIAVLVAAGGAAAVATIRPDAIGSGTIGDRFTLWRMVAEAFPARWFTGFGFGHWREHIVAVWPRYFPDVATQVWPPHNMLLQAWVDAGLVALLLTLVLVAMPLVGGLRRVSEARGEPLLGSATLQSGVVVIGLVWVLLHGMADTTRFVGDNHTLPFVAVLMALAFARTDRASVR
ncbi:O-antigen ligase family protein [Microbacterium karelineae]|uniref:O-antigen ligase family protein n=1 Tax=Microbacterium karelineae TaxID=2654283 RepID=UPI0012EA9CDF|nr:O-antigen ligase family protein [Microbacterium karelineae]